MDIIFFNDKLDRGVLKKHQELKGAGPDCGSKAPTLVVLR